MTSNEPKLGGSKTQGRQGLYAKVAVFGDDIIKGMIELTKSKNEGIRLAAYRELMNKLLPDIKAVELTGENGEQLTFKIVRETKDGDSN